MEIYTNSKAADRTVFLSFPDVVQSIDVDLWQDGEKIHTFPSVTSVNEGYSVIIPLRFVQHDSTLKVAWEIVYNEDSWFHTINKTTTVDVITPILTKEEIRDIDAYVFREDSEVFKIEKAVRHIIQAYTGQSFGYYVGTEHVRGSGGSALFLPRKLVRLEGINDSTYVSGYSVDPEGYVLRKNGWEGPYGTFDVPPVKADFYGLHMHVGGAIHDPNGVRFQQWNTASTYSITGHWGYEEIPAQVKEAAKLLVNDYACADAQYRDRYLTSMTAADWRIQFHSGAFLRTGNVRADQLLSEYVVTRGWGVI